jgi:hypothetical protein
MKKRNPKKLTLHRDTVRRLEAKDLAMAMAGARLEEVDRVAKTWSDPPQCDPACGSQTVSCTL